MTLLIKAGVDISRLSRAMRHVLNVLGKLYGDFVITSTYDGNHMPGSLHYQNNAVDVRLRNFTGNPLNLGLIKSDLGEDYDVVQEDSHLHIEFDPK